jgi:SAM-dependent methyltransferase
VKKMVEWSFKHVPPSLDPAVLELGSGNGALLFALAEAGYSQNLLAGIDYSTDAVKLSTNISNARCMTDIMFSVCDFLQEDPCPLSDPERSKAPHCWDLILDKGTYDAIALGQKDANGRSPAAEYPDRLCRLLKPGGLFLITCTSIALIILRMF